MHTVPLTRIPDPIFRRAHAIYDQLVTPEAADLEGGDPFFDFILHNDPRGMTGRAIEGLIDTELQCIADDGFERAEAALADLRVDIVLASIVAALIQEEAVRRHGLRSDRNYKTNRVMGEFRDHVAPPSLNDIKWPGI